MSETEQMSQLSALYDNELSPAESELVIRRVLKDPVLRTRWQRYALIGACLRGEPVSSTLRQPDVAERVRRELALESEGPAVAAPVIARHRGERRGWSQFGRGALGGAIAAGVAAVALIAVQSMNPGEAPVQMAGTVAPAAVASEAPPLQPAPVAPVTAPPQAVVATVDTPPPSYTTPVDNSTQRLSPLGNYVVAHSQVAASAGRLLPSASRLLPASAAMNGYDITQGTVVMTEAEIGAYR